MAKIHEDSGSLWFEWDGTKFEQLSGSGLDTQLGGFSEFISSSVYTGEYEASDSWTDANKRKLAEWCSEVDLVDWTDKQNDRGVNPPAVPRHQSQHTSSIWLDSWDTNDNI